MSDEIIKDEAALWWESRNNEKQESVNPEEYEQEEQSFLDVDEEEETEHLTDKDVKTQENAIKISQPTAEILVSVKDALVPLLFSFIFKNIDSDKLKLDSEEKSTLVAAWANYLKEKDIEISPGLMLVISIMSIYGAKATTVIAETKRQERENEHILQEIQELKKEIKNTKNTKKNEKEV